MELIGFMHISKIFFPKDLIEGIYVQLKESGADGFERLALCAGMKQEEVFTITHILFPRQTLKKGIHGASFYVDGEELERIADWLFEKRLSMIAQVHSHPSEAYHSEADDEMAIITRWGGVSIVVPDFGMTDSYFSHSAIYRLLLESGWTRLTEVEANELIKIFT